MAHLLNAANMQKSGGSATASVWPGRDAARTFGYDFFISFALGGPPRGTQSYASDLVRKLRERDFAVFFSEDEVPAGEPLTPLLRQALHRTQILVVVVNLETVVEPRWVRTEVEEFRRRHPDRAIIPVSIGGALLNAKHADSLEVWLGDRVWLDDTEEAARTGIVTDAVVARLALAPTRRRSNTLWRWLSRSVIAVLILLTAASLVASLLLQRRGEQLKKSLDKEAVLRLESAGASDVSGEGEDGLTLGALKLLAAKALGGYPAEEIASASARFSTFKWMREAEEPVIAVTFDASSDILYSAHSDGSIHRWDSESGATTSVQVGVHEDATELQSSGGAILVRDHGKIIFLDGSLAKSASLTGLPSIALAPAFNAAGSVVAIAGITGDITLWDLKTQTQRLRRRLEGGSLTASLAFTGDGRLLVTGGTDGVLQVLSVEDGQAVRTLRTSIEVHTLASDDRGTRFLLGDQRGYLYLLNVTQPDKPILLPAEERAAITKAAFVEDGRRIVAGDVNGYLRVWDADSARLGFEKNFMKRRKVQWRVDQTADLEVAIAGDLEIGVASVHRGSLGEKLRSTSDEQSSQTRVERYNLAKYAIQVWDTKLQPVGSELKGHLDSVTALLFGSATDRLVSGGDDGRVLVWNLLADKLN
jgi:WD40 repeat protein